MKALDVYFHSQLAGALEQTSEGRIEFRYREDWIQAEEARPLSQSLPLRTETFEERECIGFFGGLLPEEYNREIIARNLGITARNDFAMLREIGGECAGAVSLVNPETTPNTAEHHYTSITENELIEILDQLPQRPLLAGRAEVRLSLAGAQNKVALYKEDGNFSLPLNESPSSHILKPEWERFPKLSINEAYCLDLARLAGLPTSQAEAQTFGQHRCLVVERYDRIRSQDGQLQRLHQEDFCQALGIPTRIKYQNEGGPDLANCFQLIRSASTRPARDLIHLFNAVIFNFLIGNNDAHGKNFSLLYTRKNGVQSVQLAPLYDLVSTASYPELSQKMAMKIGSTYLPTKLRFKDWEHHWEHIGFSKKQALKQTLEFVGQIDSLAKNPSNITEDAIGKIIQNRVENLRKMLT
jgi:serine/threonine-protein kinase HipA